MTTTSTDDGDDENEEDDEDDEDVKDDNYNLVSHMVGCMIDFRYISTWHHIRLI